MSASTYARLQAINATAARQFARLSGAAQVAAAAQLDRYLDACKKLFVEVEISTIREIIGTAKTSQGTLYNRPQNQPRRERAQVQ